MTGTTPLGPPTELAVAQGMLLLRRAVAADLPQILQLLAEDDLARSRGDTGSADGLDAYLQAFERLSRDAAQLLVVALDEERIVGTMQLMLLPGLSRRGAMRLQLEMVRVAASRRGAGLGTAMIDWALEYGRHHGAALAQLTSDGQRRDARRFYERLGFVASHVGFKQQL